MATLIIIAIVLLLILFIIITYNNLVTLKQRVKNAFSQIDVQLQKRFDLIPNLVECVKGYATHESEVLKNVTELRSSWTNAKTVKEKVGVDNALTGTLKTIMAISENYPELKANENFIQLQNQLEQTESIISRTREFYNNIVTKYNTNLQVFPSNIVASMFHFSSEELFEVEDAETRKNVKVDFSNMNNNNINS